MATFFSCTKKEDVLPSSHQTIKEQYHTYFSNGASELKIFDDNTFEYISHSENEDSIMHVFGEQRIKVFSDYQYKKITLKGKVLSKSQVEESNGLQSLFVFKVEQLNTSGNQAQWRAENHKPQYIPQIEFTHETVDSTFELVIFNHDLVDPVNGIFKYQPKYTLAP
ncbi:hypothetical protein NH26_23660 [Flammeovirga pacifica]|uniref:Uncharacterized protein n=2 Tax=Flammeovirga pacifica TaxID=915059 RepID=A0A1S1YU67_FLAPC|nr:hypothetical protein NH26_23660 [Flammeovirga pacifica]